MIDSNAMDKLYLVSESNASKIEKNEKNIIVFKETYKLPNENEKKVITSGEIAKDIISKISKTVGTNSILKATEIQVSIVENSNIYLIYSDPIKEDLEGKTLLIIENNSQLNSIDAKKIYLIPPWPIVIEKIRNKYPRFEIEPFDDKEDKIFQINYYYKNLKYANHIYR